MKTNAIVRIVLFSLALLLLLGILLSVLLFGIYFSDGKVQVQQYERVVDPTGAITQNSFSTAVQNIDIEWVAGSITIQPDESVSEIHVVETFPIGTEYQMICKQSGQTLKIKFSEESMKFPSFGINADVSKDLVINVPANWVCDELEIDAAAATVYVNDLQINEVVFDGASGECVFDNCDIVEMDISTASGNVEFSGVLKELDFSAASAKFYGEFLQVPNRLNLDTMSGDLDLILPEYCGFTCKLDAMSGDFDSDFEFGLHDGTYIHGDGACQIKVSAMSGDVNILKGVSVPEQAGSIQSSNP